MVPSVVQNPPCVVLFVFFPLSLSFHNEYRSQPCGNAPTFQKPSDLWTMNGENNLARSPTSEPLRPMRNDPFPIRKWRASPLGIVNQQSLVQRDVTDRYVKLYSPENGSISRCSHSRISTTAHFLHAVIDHHRL